MKNKQLENSVLVIINALNEIWDNAYGLGSNYLFDYKITGIKNFERAAHHTLSIENDIKKEISVWEDVLNGAITTKNKLETLKLIAKTLICILRCYRKIFKGYVIYKIAYLRFAIIFNSIMDKLEK